jgi:hypothetical protein
MNNSDVSGDTVIAAVLAARWPTSVIEAHHGFWQAGNIKRALDAELYCYASLAFKVGLRY